MLYQRIIDNLNTRTSTKDNIKGLSGAGVGKGFSKNKTFFQEIDLEDELCHAFESCFSGKVNPTKVNASGLLDDLWDHSADEGTAPSGVGLYGAQEGSSVAASSAGVVDTSGKEDLVQGDTLLLLVLREGIVI